MNKYIISQEDFKSINEEKRKERRSRSDDSFMNRQRELVAEIEGGKKLEDYYNEDDIKVNIIRGKHLEKNLTRDDNEGPDMTMGEIMDTVTGAIKRLNRILTFKNTFQWLDSNLVPSEIKSAFAKFGFNQSLYPLNKEIVIHGKANVNVVIVLYKISIDANQDLFEYVMFIKTAMRKARFVPNDKNDYELTLK